MLAFLQCPLLLPQPLALPDSKPVPEDQPNLLQAQPRSLGVREHTEEIPEEGQARVEPERARGGDAAHEREIRRADDQVPRPVRRRRERGPDAAHLEREQLSLLPGHGSESRRVRRDVEDHREQHDRGPGV